jgi:hypothetical protein
VPVEDQNPFCAACRLNQIVPDLSIPENLARWHKLELAKRRVIFTLLSLRLPIESDTSENRPSLRFRFLGDSPGSPPVLTGHEGGLITINIAEADDVERERRRVHLNEPYRTLLGHLRHEVAHYYWVRLIADSGWVPRFRELFGDETRDYGAALQTYYQKGPPPDWQTHFVSAYASAHPSEDWAETGAHYLHIRDTLETAAASGLTLQIENSAATKADSASKNTAEAKRSFDRLLENWLPLTCVLNNLNRGMGLPDLYPFVLTGPAIKKLSFVHEVIQSWRQEQTSDGRLESLPL